MKRIPDHLSPEQAWERLSSVTPLPCEERLTAEALDHCLADDFTALEDVPVANRSFMDGYAVRSADLAAVPVRLNLVGEVLMGELPGFRIRAGEAAAIPTGGFLPEGADAVVMQEDTDPDPGAVNVLRRIQAGENVQAQGEDFHRGDPVCAAGRRLRAQDLSAIATFGADWVKVRRMPTVTVISTGNELVPYTESPGGGRIRETNSLALVMAARKAGLTARSMGIVRDEFDAQREAIEHALGQSDVVLISGGSSVGERDYTLQVIESLPGHTVRFHGIAIRPGNPTIFATIGSHSVFGLPGQPVSSLIVFYLFVLPFLRHLAGEHINYGTLLDETLRVRDAKLTAPVRPLKAKTDYLRVRLDGAHATPLPGKSASLSTLALADGFIVVPPGGNDLDPGNPVRVYIFP